jgi:hypothetical protein
MIAYAYRCMGNNNWPVIDIAVYQKNTGQLRENVSAITAFLLYFILSLYMHKVCKTLKLQLLFKLIPCATHPGKDMQSYLPNLFVHIHLVSFLVSLH